MTTTQVTHKVQLVDGNFTASEALDVINNLINEKINFHKIHRLSMCEGNSESDTAYDDSRLHQLIQEKEDFKAIYKEAKMFGRKISINGTLNVKVIED